MGTQLGHTALLGASTQGRASNLPTLSPEERKALAAKALLAKKAKHEARQKSGLRCDFMDASHWDDLARERSLRLPPWGEPCTVSKMRTFLHKAGMSQTEWEKENGCKLADFPKNNPDWPTRGFAGLVLEIQAERRQPT